jgi:RNA polymerase sigma factor (TIGR02999 family)
MSEVTRVLSAIEAGDPRAAEELLPLVYDQLRKLAAAKMAREKSGQTLDATALVHEAYVRLVQGEEPRGWDSRGHFFSAAAEAMRRILVERARYKLRDKHGGRMRRVELLDEHLPSQVTDDQQILALDEALTKLAQVRPQAAMLVQLRFFAGLTADESALAVGISARSARRLWLFSQAWLRREMESMKEHNE